MSYQEEDTCMAYKEEDTRLGMEKPFVELVRMNKCVVPNSGVGFRIQVNGMHPMECFQC